MCPMAFNKEEYEKARDDLAVGNLSMGGLHISWDFREVLKEQRAKELQEERLEYYPCKSGRLIMPKYGII